MGIRHRIAKALAPDMYSAEAVREIVQEEVKKARMALPVVANYDPNDEGYRRLMGGNQHLRDLAAIDQDRMFEVAYFMWDNSAMVRRMATLDRSFLFAEPITVTSDDEEVKKVIDRFWEGTDNSMDLDFPEQMMWLSLLGEQCWPVTVNKHNGHVALGYAAPDQIKAVYTSVTNVKQVVQVELRGTGGRQGKKMAVIREDKDFHSKTFGRLVGECFFFAINHPPNSPRGRSDYLTLFDWIDGLERYGFNYLERAEFMFNFVWDVMLKGMTEEQIREWLQNNSPPDPGSIRAHNESVEWSAVAPDIKAHDFTKGFDTAKSFIMGSAGRPASWYGEGGKAYQTEAEIFGQVPIKDLDQRQLYIKKVLEKVVRFVVDQAVIAGRLTAKQAEAGFTVNMPEISKKDLTKLVNGVPQLATALAIAEQNRWIGMETAVKIFGGVIGQLGVDIDVQAELDRAKKHLERKAAGVTDDYE